MTAEGEDPIMKMVAEVTESLTDKERLGFFRGLEKGLSARQEALRFLETSREGIGNTILQSLGKSLNRPKVQEALQARRGSGEAAEWLEEQVKLTIIESVDIVMKKISKKN